jgi:hypothetical protein
MQAAVTIGDYLTEHANAAYTLMGTDTDVYDAEHVWRGIVRHGGSEFTKRDLHQSVRRRFPKPDSLDAPLAELTRRNMIRPKPTAEEPRVGRPASPAFEVNPAATRDTSRTTTTREF